MLGNLVWGGIGWHDFTLSVTAFLKTILLKKKAPEIARFLSQFPSSQVSSLIFYIFRYHFFVFFFFFLWFFRQGPQAIYIKHNFTIVRRRKKTRSEYRKFDDRPNRLDIKRTL